MSHTPESYIAQQDEPIAQIMQILYQFIMASSPAITCRLNYGVPFFYQKKWLCYLNPLKKGGVELAFVRANELSNENAYLDFKKRKQVAGISIISPNEIPFEAIVEVLKEALLLDSMKRPK